MLELADEADSKSAAGDSVRVRPPLPAEKKTGFENLSFFISDKYLHKAIFVDFGILL